VGARARWRIRRAKNVQIAKEPGIGRGAIWGLLRSSPSGAPTKGWSRTAPSEIRPFRSGPNPPGFTLPETVAQFPAPKRVLLTGDWIRSLLRQAYRRADSDTKNPLVRDFGPLGGHCPDLRLREAEKATVTEFGELDPLSGPTFSSVSRFGGRHLFDSRPLACKPPPMAFSKVVACTDRF
jgi:hypothetical protein